MALAFGCADRLAGGDYVEAMQDWVKAHAPWFSPVANMRSTGWAALALAAVLAIIGHWTRYGPALALLAISLAAWRWDGWTAFGGDMNPKTPAQRLGLFERHLLAVPAFLPVIVLFQHFALGGALLALVALVAWAAFATLLGVQLEVEAERDLDVNAFVEFTRGLGLGAVVAVTLI